MSFVAIYHTIARIESWIIAGFCILGGLVTFASHMAHGTVWVGFLAMVHIVFSGFVACLVLQVSVRILRWAFDERAS